MWKRILKIFLILTLLVGLTGNIWRQVQAQQAKKSHLFSQTLSAVPVAEEEKKKSIKSKDLPDETAILSEKAKEQESVHQKLDAEDAYADELKNKNLSLLQEINSDVIGWIELPNTTLSYPLMQGEDNQHYLSYGWDGQRNYSGSIYLDYRSDMQFNDFNSILYGHRMYNNSMMDALGGYAEQSFWEEHPSIYVVEENAVRRYDVFAAYRTDIRDTHSYRLGLEDDAGQQAYINHCLKNSQLETGIVPELGDRILTLSTCTPQNEKNYRWIVHCVLRYEELLG